MLLKFFHRFKYLPFSNVDLSHAIKLWICSKLVIIVVIKLLVRFIVPLSSINETWINNSPCFFYEKRKNLLNGITTVSCKNKISALDFLQEDKWLLLNIRKKAPCYQSHVLTYHLTWKLINFTCFRCIWHLRIINR